ncbi:MAG: T9SS type A sorting domain-containing protein [Bacteroidetes bacterium]|nr:T9SS type A sorting domain-containing protein [Bacteroidota bacterium]
MIKLYLTTLLILVLSFSYVRPQTMTLTWNFEFPVIKKDRNGYSRIEYNDCYHFGNEGYPLLPYRAANVLLPLNREVESIRIISEEYYADEANIRIRPAGKPVPLSKKPDKDYFPLPNAEVYNSSLPYPGKITGNTNTHFLSGHPVGSFSICPVIYIPAENTVTFLKSITLEITTKNTAKAVEAARFFRKSAVTEQRLKKIVDNPESLETYSFPKSLQSYGEYDILLITDNALLPAFGDYIAFKESCGFAVKAITVDDIYLDYSGQDAQEKIRNCITDYYLNTGISYVILGGDADAGYAPDNIIPHRGFFSAPSGEDAGYDDFDIPSDLYYSCLDGTWNDDGDNKWGEPGEDDLLAEVSIGRICADNTGEIENFINKLMLYQSNPVVADIEKALLLGEDLGWTVWGGEHMEELVTGCSNYGYTTVGIPPSFSITKLYDMVAVWDISEVFDRFNTGGVNLLCHLGHSNVNYNMKMYNSDVTISNFQNDGITRGFAIGYTQGCYCGSFDNRTTAPGGYETEDCFSEAITTLETGEVAIIANSRYGWGDGECTDGPSQYLNRQFIDAIFGEGITLIGDANGDSKEDNIAYIDTSQVIRWCAYEATLFGDPTMDIWTAQPEPIIASYASAVPLGTTSILFETDAPYARIGLVQDGQLIGRGLADNTGNIILNLFAPVANIQSINITITAHNRTRHIGTVNVTSDLPYVTYNAHVINDAAENNNGAVDFGESVLLSAELKNVGSIDATDVTATLSANDSYITVTDNTEYYGAVNAGDSASVSNGYAFSVSDSIPDGHDVLFGLTVTGNDSTWYSSFLVEVNAPRFLILSLSVSDPLGNSNGRLDPGETADILVSAKNAGNSDASAVAGYISTPGSEITINTSSYSFGTFAAQTQADAIFNVTADAGVAIGTVVTFDCEVISGYYSAQKTFHPKVGLIVEDWESQTFTSYNWQQGGDVPWTITDGSPYEGSFAARSGIIPDEQSSELSLSVFCLSDDTVSFFKKVSSEPGYDFLIFYIDDEVQEYWSGEDDWSEEKYPVTQGNHTFRWSYIKDMYESGGDDCAWIDFIAFPQFVANPPYFTSEAEVIASEGALYTYNIVVADNDTDDTIVISCPVKPPWLNFTDNGGGSASLSGIPAAQDVGVHPVVLSATDGAAVVEQTFSIFIGYNIEDWETNGFTSYNWSGNNYPWTIVSQDQYEGSYTAKSAEISNNQKSELILAYNNIIEDDYISFYRKVSSEGGWDFLKFYIDDVLQDKWSGESGWEMVQFPVTAGDHILKWSYEKDQAVSDGDDCAWVDFIVLPPASPLCMEQLSSETTFICYPNPGAGKYVIETGGQVAGKVKAEVSAITGQYICSSESFENIIEIDLSAYPDGVYLLKVSDERRVAVIRLVKQ